MRAYLFLIFFVLPGQWIVASAQNQSANLEKYWNYRNRLVTEFMVVGDGQGMSQAAATIFPAIKRMNWSDNTVLHGWYIGVLALEYHLLTSSDYPGFDNGDTAAINRTLNELQLAIAALLRMDDTAEIAYPPPCDSLGKMRNGFFIRDDVPRSFFSNFPGIDSLQSESTSTTNVYFSEMSQDQVYHLLFGLALVKKFIPDGLVVNGMQVRQEAINEAMLMVEWVNRDAWMIKNPACQDKNVARGHDASLLSHGLNEAIKFISDGAANYDSDVTPLFTTIWGTLTSPSNPGYTNINNLHMAMTLAAIGDSWSDSTLNSLMTLAEAHRWYVYPMLHLALHEDRTDSGYVSFEDTINTWSLFMLNEAPEDGPRNSYPDTSGHGYAVFNRFLREWELQYTGNPFNAGGIFNGLDYMMLHNLYYTTIPAKWIVGLRNNEAERRLTADIYPNPVTNTLYLRLPYLQELTVTVYNTLGKAVHTAACAEHVCLMNIQRLPAGIYTLSITDKSGSAGFYPFVKK